MVLGLTDRLTGPLAGVERRFTTFERRAFRVADQLDRVGDRMQSVGRRMAIGGVALAAPFVLATRAAMNFETAMSDVEKVVDFDAYAGGAARFGREIRALSRELPLMQADLAAIAAEGGARGVDARQLTQYTRDVGLMSFAFGMAADQAGDVAGSIASQFGIAFDQLRPLGDTVNALDNAVGASAPNILDFLSRVGGTANQLNMTAEQTAAIGARMIELGRPPEIAATSLGTMLSRLADVPGLSRPARAAFDGLGLDAVRFSELMQRDGTQGVLTFLDAVRRTTNPLAALNAVLGIESGRHIVPLLNDMDRLREVLALAGDRSQTSGSMVAELGRKSGTAAAQMVRLRSAGVEIAITIGTYLLPPVTALAERTANLLGRVSALADRYPGLTRAVTYGGVALAGFLLIAGGGLMTLGFLTQSVGQGIRAFVEIRGTLRGARAAYLRTLVAARAYAVSQGVATAASLRGAGGLRILTAATRARIVAANAHAAATLRSVVSLRWLRAGLTMATAGFSRLTAATLANLAGMRALTLGGLARSMMAGARAVWMLNVALLANPIVWIGAAIVGAAFLIWRYWQPIAAFFRGVWAGLLEGLAPVMPAIRAVVTPIVGFFRTLFTQANFSAETLARVGEVGRTVGRFIGTSLSWAVRIVTGAVRLFGPILVGMFAPVAATVGAVVIVFRAAFRAIRVLMSGGTWREAGAAFVNTLIAGIRSAASRLYDVVRGMMRRVRDFLPFSPAKTGPLSDLDRTGPALVGTVAAGITPRPITRAMDRALAPARAALSGSLGAPLRASAAGTGAPSPLLSEAATARATEGGAVHFTFAPTVHVNGGGPDVRAQVAAALADQRAAFDRQLTEALRQRDRRRL